MRILPLVWFERSNVRIGTNEGVGKLMTDHRGW